MSTNVIGTAKSRIAKFAVSGALSLLFISVPAGFAFAATVNTTTTISNASTLTSTASTVGQSYTVNVNVVGASSRPTGGTVTISDGTGASCTDSSGSSGSGNTRTYSCSLTSTTAGSKTITASYGGSTSFGTTYSPSTSSGASHTVNPDTTPPTITQVTAVPTLTNDTTPNYTFHTNESGTITYGGDCSSATTAASASGTGNNTITFNTLAAGLHSNCTITVTDASANASAPLAVNSFTIDTIPPTVTINQGASHADPAVNTSPIVFDVVFSESVTGFSASGVTISGTATHGTVTVTGSGATYTVSVPATKSGTVIATVNANAAHDGAGNNNVGSTSTDNSVTYSDTVAPVLAQVTAVANPTTDTTPNYTFSSTEAGTITYGGDCSSTDTTANSGSNTETFSTLAAGTHSNCTITVTDASGNVSLPLAVNSFTITVAAGTCTLTSLISNPCFESSTGTATLTPTGWSADTFGTNTFTFTYPVAGAGTSGRGAEISATTVDAGSGADWSFDPITIPTPSAPGIYTFSDQYKSTVDTEVDVHYAVDNVDAAALPSGECAGANTAGTGFEDCTEPLAHSVTASPSAFTTFKAAIVPPKGAQNIVIEHLLLSSGSLTVDNYALNATISAADQYTNGMVSLTFDDGYLDHYTNALPILKNAPGGAQHGTFYIIPDILSQPDYMTPSQVASLEFAGNDIESHTADHCDLVALNNNSASAETTVGCPDGNTQSGPVTSLTEIQSGKTQTASIATTSPNNNVAYPFGSYDGAVETQAASTYATGGARTIDVGYNTKATVASDRYRLVVENVYSNTATSTIDSWINSAKTNKVWLIIVFHQIDAPQNANDIYAATPQTLQDTVNYLAQAQVCVQTVAQGLNGSPCVPSDITPPPVPIIDTHPNANSNVLTTNFTFHDTEVGATFKCSLDADPFNVCISPFTGTTIAGTHTFHVEALDAALNVSTSTNFTWNIDTTPPAAPVITTASQATSTTSIIVTGTAEASSTIAISGGASVAIGTTTPAGVFSLPVTLTANANNTLTATASDAATNVSAPSASVLISEDSTAPGIVLATTPAAIAHASTTPVSFTATLSEADVTDFATTSITVVNGTVNNFTGSGTAYTFNVTPTAEGTVTVSVAAGAFHDAVANPSTVSNTVSFVYDHTAPVIAAHAAVTAEATSPAGAVVTYTAPTATDAIDATLTTATCVPASGTTFALGATPITCNAVDATGNAATPTTFTVTVSDTVKPIVVVNPVGTPTNAHPSITFTATDATTLTTQCSTDGTTFTACTSPFTPTLGDGTYAVTVKATDQGNNVGTSTSNSFTVDADAPAVTLSVTPGAVINAAALPTAQIVYSVSDSLSLTNACSIDGAATTTCAASPIALSAYTEGTHTFSILATNSVGNTTFKTTTFSIDFTAPTVTVTSLTTKNTAPTITGTTNDNGSPIVVAVNGATSTVTAVAGVWSLTTPTLADGTYPITAVSTDAAGNVSATANGTLVINTKAPNLTVNAPTPAITTSLPVNVTVTGTTDASVNIQVTIAGIATSTTADLTGAWTATLTVPTGTADGIYPVSVVATDALANSANNATQNFTVDLQGPAIDPVADVTTEATSPAGATVTYATPVAHDAVDGTSDVVVCVPASGTTFVIGTTPVSCNTSDVSAHAAPTVTFNVKVQDTTPPTITLIGSNPMHISTGDTFVDPGATASDLVAGDVTASIHATGTVDGTTPATYTVTYTATDGTNATSTQRSVIVSDLTIDPLSEQTVNVNQTSVTITWTTSNLATSRVVWGTSSVTDASSTEAKTGGDNNYGYPNTTTTTDTAPEVITHSVTISGLTANTTYYFRPISQGSPETDGAEVTTTTPVNPPVQQTVSSGGGGGGGGGGGITYTYAVKINNGAATTTTESVTLNITPAGSANQMEVSNTPAFTGATWIPFQATYPWTLTTGTGVKTVYVRYGANSAIVSSAQTSIYLDETQTGPTPAAQPQGQVLGASTQACYNFTMNLQVGSTGNDVTALQNLLTAQGDYGGPISGYFGNLTKAAVMAYQAAHGIAQVGNVGPQTRAVLNQCGANQSSESQGSVLGASTSTSEYIFTRTLQVGSTGDDVTALQNRLTAEGDYSGPITGYFGNLTKAAVIAYQAAHGLDQVGIVGPKTRAVLNGQ